MTGHLHKVTAILFTILFLKYDLPAAINIGVTAVIRYEDRDHNLTKRCVMFSEILLEVQGVVWYKLTGVSG